MSRYESQPLCAWGGKKIHEGWAWPSEESHLLDLFDSQAQHLNRL